MTHENLHLDDKLQERIRRIAAVLVLSLPLVLKPEPWTYGPPDIPDIKGRGPAVEVTPPDTATESSTR